jgi:hypothetical protein
MWRMNMDNKQPGEITVRAMREAVSSINEGIMALVNGMKEDPGYDNSCGYDAKNTYFARCEEIGRPLFDVNRSHLGELDVNLEVQFYGFAELYHNTMLQCILAYEQKSGKHFNKGMVYGNLGVAQIANGKLDEGIASLLTADYKDRDFINRDPHHILNEGLWGQFEKPRLFPYIKQLTDKPCLVMGAIIDDAFLEGFMSSIELQDRLVLEGSIWAVQDDLRLDRFFSGVHTKSRLLSELRDICWLIESLLRRGGPGTSYVKTNPRAGIQNLLCSAVGGRGVSFPSESLSCTADDTQDFVNCLETVLTAKVKTEVRVLHCLALVRNYTAHHFDPAPTPDWFGRYEEVLGLVLSTMFYLKNIKALYERRTPHP